MIDNGDAPSDSLLNDPVMNSTNRSMQNLYLFLLQLQEAVANLKH